MSSQKLKYFVWEPHILLSLYIDIVCVFTLSNTRHALLLCVHTALLDATGCAV